MADLLKTPPDNDRLRRLDLAMPVRGPIGIRHKLRNRIIGARAWAASGDLPA